MVTAVYKMKLNENKERRKEEKRNQFKASLEINPKQ